MRNKIFREHEWSAERNEYGVELVAKEPIEEGAQERTWQYFVSGLGSVKVSCYEGRDERDASLAALMWYMVGHLPAKQKYTYVIRGWENAPAVLFDMETACMMPAWFKFGEHERNILIGRCNEICSVGLPSAAQYCVINEEWWDKYMSLSEKEFMEFLKENGFY